MFNCAPETGGCCKSQRDTIPCTFSASCTAGQRQMGLHCTVCDRPTCGVWSLLCVIIYGVVIFALLPYMLQIKWQRSTPWGQAVTGMTSGHVSPL